MPMISTALIFERSNRAPAMGNQAPNRQHDYGADGRRDEARALIGSVPAQHPPEIRGQECTHDPENGREDKSARFVLAGHDEFRNHACDKADNDDPKDTHGILLLPSPPLRPVNLPPRSFAAKVFASYNVRTAKANGPKSKGESCRRNLEVAISRRSVVAATGKGISAKQGRSPRTDLVSLYRTSVASHSAGITYWPSRTSSRTRTGALRRPRQRNQIQNGSSASPLWASGRYRPYEKKKLRPQEFRLRASQRSLHHLPNWRPKRLFATAAKRDQ